jgi:hypothetical protein
MSSAKRVNEKPIAFSFSMIPGLWRFAEHMRGTNLKSFGFQAVGWT